MKKIFSIFAALLFAGSVLADDELMLTMDLASASDGTATKLETAAALLAFLQKSVDDDAYIATAEAPTSVWAARGTAGTDNTIPEKVLKVGTASGAGSIEFNVATSLAEVTKVVITAYGWKASSKIAVNGSETQEAATKFVKKTYTFPLATASRNIKIDVTTSCMCIETIELYKAEDPSAPRIKAANLDLGEIILDVNESSKWLDEKITVVGANLTDDIVIFAHSSGITITEPVGDNLPSTGGDIKFQIEATPWTTIDESITLQSSGAPEKVVKIVGTVSQKKEMPAVAFNAPVTISTDDKSYAASVKIGSETITAYRGGKSGGKGTMTVKVGAGAEKLYFYAAAWSGEAGTIVVSTEATGVTLSGPQLVSDQLDLLEDAGITGSSSTFNLAIAAEDLWRYIYEIDITGATAETVIKLTSEGGTGTRFVMWSPKQVGGTATSIENAVIENNAAKQIVNGQVVIIRDNVRYNVIGQTIE